MIVVYSEMERIFFRGKETSKGKPCIVKKAIESFDKTC